MIESSRITLREKSVYNNINFLRKKLGKKVKISSVVKANAYGHGIEQIVPLFEKAGIDHFSVFDYNEATRVANSLAAPQSIMIMGWISDNNVKNAILKGFDFFVFNNERLLVALEHAKALNKKARIHLEAETGMNRSGLNNQELIKAITLINDNKEYFDVQGFCTHLAGAESISNHFRIQKQIKKYHKMLTLAEKSGIIPQFRHMANSAAAFVYPKTRMDLVRIGIMQYGFWSSAETFIHYLGNKAKRIDPLERILGWDSKIMSIKEIKTGEYIGYGITFLAQSDIKTALIPVGYSCGYSRSLSNRGRVLIRGQRCSVIGVVNMNMIIADITNIPDAEVGDEVVIIGRQGDLEIKVSAFSDISNELNYEVLAHLSGKIKRTIIN
ncbi:MAG: alanine racemase [Bacteroidales bacterium]|nr:alanine racemase [Bacteroidales bacterium]